MATTVAGPEEALAPPADLAAAPRLRRAARIRALVARRKWLVLAAVVALVGTGVGLYLTRGGSSTSFRTVAASLGTIRQEISATGTIEDLNQANLNFGVSGLVKTVDVAVGQKVTAGQVLATEDTTSLQASLDSAQAQVASAQSKLDTDTQGATTSQLSSAQNQIASSRLTLSTAQQNVTNTEQSNAQSLASAQTAVQSAETTLSGDQTTYQQDQSSLGAAQQKESYDCQGDASGAAGSSGGSGGSGAGSGSGSGASAGSSSSQCAADQSTVSSDQTKVNQDQQTVNKDQAGVQTAEQSLQSTQLKNTQSLQQAQNQVASDQLSLNNAQSSLTALQTSATPSQLDADQASVASAQAGLATAQDNLANATIVSPIAGTVAAVNISVGQSASGGGSSSSSSSSGSSGSSAAGALSSLLGGGSTSSSSTSSGSSSGDVQVVSPGAYAVSTSVSDSEIGQLKVGDQAVITPDGSVAPVYGTVSALGLIATSSSGVATYPVTIAITGSPSGLFAGAGANVSLIVEQLTNVLTVPTSAVHTIGSRSFVDLLQNGKEVLHAVTIGGSGSGSTQITSGLSQGQEVVLATITGSVPTSGGGTGAGGRFGGLVS